MGDSIWSWAISGATTGIVGGLLSNPRYLPVTTLCFTGLGVLGYFVGFSHSADVQTYLAGNRYYRKKSLRLKEESGVITEEERQQIEDMKLFKKENLQKIVSFKIGKE